MATREFKEKITIEADVLEVTCDNDGTVLYSGPREGFQKPGQEWALPEGASYLYVAGKGNNYGERCYFGPDVTKKLLEQYKK